MDDLQAGLNTRHPAISESAPLPQSHVQDLTGTLSGLASLHALQGVDNRLTSALNTKHQEITLAHPLSQSLVEGLQDALNAAQTNAATEISDVKQL